MHHPTHSDFPARWAFMVLFPVLATLLILPVSPALALLPDNVGPGGTARIQAAVRKVKSNNAGATLSINPISPQPPFFDMPPVDAGESFVLNAGGENKILNGIPFGGSWSGPGVTPTGIFSPESCGSFRLFYEVPDLGIDSVLMTVVNTGGSTSPINISGPDFICGGAGTTSFSATPSGGQWSEPLSSSGGLAAAGLAGTIVNIQYSAAVNGCSFTQSKVVPVFPSSVNLVLNGSQISCGTQEPVLSFELEPALPFSVSWYRNNDLIPGANNFFYTPSQSGTYKAEIKPIVNGSVISCPILTNALSLTVNNNPPPAAPDLVRNGNILSISNYPSSNSNNWYMNGLLLPGQNGAEYAPLADGIYHAVHKDGECTSDYSNGISFTFTSITGISSKIQFSVFPNPVKDFLFVKYLEDFQSAQIVDVLGRRHELSFHSSGALDFRSFPTGVFHLLLTNSHGTVKSVRILHKD